MNQSLISIPILMLLFVNLQSQHAYRQSTEEESADTWDINAPFAKKQGPEESQPGVQVGESSLLLRIYQKPVFVLPFPD